MVPRTLGRCHGYLSRRHWRSAEQYVIFLVQVAGDCPSEARPQGSVLSDSNGSSSGTGLALVFVEGGATRNWRGHSEGAVAVAGREAPRDALVLVHGDSHPGTMVLVHGIHKKTQKTPASAIALARKRMKEGT